MLFSYNWLQDYIKINLPKPKKLAEILTMHSFEVESVEKKDKDYVLDIDVLPNRAPDCFSYIGVAREIAAITDKRFQVSGFKFQENKKSKTKDFVGLEVKDKNDCPRYTARVIQDVKVGPSPKWIRERLEACGLNSISNIVDIANYVMLETGQPLHAFDYDKLFCESNRPTRGSMNVKKIIVRRAKKGEKIATLDDKKYDLDKDVLIIADEKDPLAIAGIKGGKKAEIDKKTKTIVLESANFDSKVIRQASKKLGLRTDASWRFENGINPNLTEVGINRAAKLISEIANGKVASGLADFYPKKIKPKKIKLDLNYVSRLLGIKVSQKEIEKILKKLEFEIKKPSTSILRSIEVIVPTWRLDINIQEDLIEEIGRIYGYDKIPAGFPSASLVPPERNSDIFWEDKTKNILKEAGFTEVYNYSFIGEKEAKIFDYNEENAIELENPISRDFRYLRPNLIPNLLKNVESNFRYFSEIKIFELGKIFNKIKNQKSKIKIKNQNAKIVEKRMLTGLIAEKVNNNELFYQLKGSIDMLLNKLGISDIYYDDYQATPENSNIKIWQKGKTAEIKVGGEEIGFLGELSDKILQSLKIKGGVALFDIDFEKLNKLCSEEHQYQPISVHPSAVRDIAVLVPLDVKVVDVLNKINAAGGKLVKDVDLFDIYEGSELPQGKKNFAFHIIYQAEDRTLTSKEIDKLQQKIVRALEEDAEWEVRK